MHCICTLVTTHIQNYFKCAKKLSAHNFDQDVPNIDRSLVKRLNFFYVYFYQIVNPPLPRPLPGLVFLNI